MNPIDLLNRDIRLENLSEKVTLASLPKPVKEKRVVLKKKDMSEAIYLTPEALNARDLGLEAQASKISKNAIKDLKDYKPPIIKSNVTQEMIKDYQDELANQAYEDPITGQTFRYVPSNTDIDLEQPNLVRIPRQGEIDANLASLQRKQIRIAELEDDILRAQRVEENFRNRGVVLSPQDQREIADRYTALNREIGTLTMQSEAQQRFLDEIPINIQDNATENERVSTYNKGLLKARSEELNILNRGRLNITQELGESDEDFKQRLLDVGQVTVDPLEMAKNAELRQVTRFKKFMEQIIDNNSTTETVIKIASPIKNIFTLDQDYDKIFLYNKYWTALKKNYLEVYGEKNKDVTPQEIVDFFDNVIAKVSFQDKPKDKIPDDELPPLPFEAPIKGAFLSGPLPPIYRPKSDLPDLPPLPSSSQIKKSRKMSKDVGAIARAEADARDFGYSSAQDPVFPAELGDQNPHKMDKQTLLKLYANRYQTDTGITVDKSRPVGQIREIFADYDYFPSKLEYDIRERRGQTAISSYFTKGSGMKKYPVKVKLGKIMIKPNELVYKNKLIMLSHAGSGLTGIRQQQVSDELVEIIMNLLNDKTITHNDLKRLDLREKQMLDNLLYLSGLHKSSDNTLSQTRQAMKHRLELIEGEINAGNTNPDLKKELHGLLLKMAHGGLIHYPQAYSHYRNLTKHFK
jgi:hypothetical protein